MNKEKILGIIKKTLKIVITIVVVGLVIYGVNSSMNVRVLSEKRAEKNARLFVEKNKINVKRLTCAGDTVDPKYKVRDGYGSCALVTKEGEKIMLQCPADFLENLMGAKSCKEYFLTLNLSTTNTGAIGSETTANEAAL